MSNEPNLPSLKDRVLKAGGWTFGGYVASSVIRLGGNLVLARLLAPEMFGLMAIVYVMMTGFALFSDVGLVPNIVQSKRGEDPAFLNTAWVVQIARGALIWLAALLLSVALHFMASNQWLPVGSVYADPLLPLVIAIYSSTQLMAGFSPMKVAVARRRFVLARMVQIDIATQIAGLTVMVAWATQDRSIWALVGGTIFASTLKLILYTAFLPGSSSRWQWDPVAFREIFAFGKWVFLSSTIGFLVINGDRLLLGGLINAQLMGLYSIAFMFVSFPQLALNQMMSRVAYPALSEIVREHPARLRASYYRFRLPFDVLTLFIAGVLFTFGTPLINLLYDSRYAGAGPIMETLAVGLLATRYQLADQCYLALGKPHMLTPVYSIRLASIYLLVPTAFSMYGFDGALWAIVASPFVALPVIFYLKIKNQLLDTRRELVVLPVVLLGAAVGKLGEMLLAAARM